MLYNPLIDRTTSTHPISIGTSMMLESIVSGQESPYDDAVIEKNDIRQYKHFAINVYTLMRNILSSLKSSEVSAVKEQDLTAVLLSEMNYISEVCSHLFDEIEYYWCEYSNISKLHPMALFIANSTDKQKHITHLMLSSISAITQAQRGAVGQAQRVVVYKNNYEKQKDTTLIFTNHSYNLLAFTKSDICALIESHTARLKTYPLWYTKLYKAKDYPWMPFNYVTLQVFGDGTIIAPKSKYLREFLISVGEKYKWNFSTSTERIKLNVSFERDNPLRHDILDLF